MSNLFWLTDAQMARLQPFFPKSHGKPRVDDRRVLSGIIFINRNGLQWCDALKEYGPPKALYNRWKRWGEKGVFARMMEGLASQAAVLPARWRSSRGYCCWTNPSARWMPVCARNCARACAKSTMPPD